VKQPTSGNRIQNVSLTRRQIIATSLVAPAAGLALSARPAAAQSAFAAELMAPGPLPDKFLGKADAPITIVEYASMTCPHCMHWFETVLPHIKTNYIDTGKARLIFREFPLDQLAAAVSMLARCAPEDKYFDVVDLYYSKFETWVRSDKPLDAIRNLAKQGGGFTEESFKTCLTDQGLLDKVMGMRTRAADKLKVDATPTFFVNGKKAEEFYTPETVDKTLKAYL
jgi:protein-disulfide isomerase